MYINLSTKQLNQVNTLIKQWQQSSLNRLSPNGIEKAQTDLLFFDMIITQDTQVQAIEEVLQIKSNIGDMITEN